MDVALGDIAFAIGVAVGEGYVGVRVGDGATVGVLSQLPASQRLGGLRHRIERVRTSR